ncbi:TetR family transcriptional regulator [Rhodobacterales bacterium HKCCE2091]|nr:TetR family transcriptional regulator [Rhodobacterales bacterium HKCCE2091]
MNADPQIKKGRKYGQVIAGAREVFLREGFEGASVDAIARDAGVSKATLYSYFPDKESLFHAVLNGVCNLQRTEGLGVALNATDVPSALRHIARAMITNQCSESNLALFRVCVGETQRFPELGRQFYETGPAEGLRQLAGYFRSPAAQEALDIVDPDAAADIFVRLCRTNLMIQRVLGVIDEPDEETVAAEAEAAVEIFLARFARRD